MAKKVAKKRAPITDLIPATPDTSSLITSSVDVNKEDLIAVGINQVEEQLTADYDIKRVELDDNRDEAKNLTKKLVKVLQTLADDEFAGLIVDLKEAFATIGVKKTDHSCNCDQPQRNYKGKFTTVRVTMLLNGGTEKKTNFEQTNVDVRKQKDVKVPTEAVEIYDALVVNSEAEKQIQTELMDLKRKQSNLPRLERKYRAKLATAHMSKSREGREMLAVITADITADIKSLPGN